jgi:hypothetical protein
MCIHINSNIHIRIDIIIDEMFNIELKMPGA